MVIHLAPELEVALSELARRQGVTPEILVNDALRAMFPIVHALPTNQDEWEQRLRSLAADCGVSLSDVAVSSEGLYE
jgi:hypothetical protein